MQQKFLRFINSPLFPVTVAAMYITLMVIAALIPKVPVYIPQDLAYRDISENRKHAEIEKMTLATSQLAINTPINNMAEDNNNNNNTTNNSIQCSWGNFNISIENFELICRTVQCEAGNQDIDTQIMAALTILNRIKSDKFPDTVSEVVYQDEQYKVTQWTNFESYYWTESVEQAVTYALETNEHPADMFYFRTSRYHNFGQPYIQSGNLYFSTED